HESDVRGRCRVSRHRPAGSRIDRFVRSHRGPGSRKARLIMKARIAWLIVLLVPTAASAQEIRIHGKGGAAHAVTTPQSTELGWGGGGSLGAELTLGKYAGVQIQTGAMGLSQGNPPSDK